MSLRGSSRILNLVGGILNSSVLACFVCTMAKFVYKLVPHPQPSGGIALFHKQSYKYPVACTDPLYYTNAVFYITADYVENILYNKYFSLSSNFIPIDDQNPSQINNTN